MMGDQDHQLIRTYEKKKMLQYCEHMQLISVKALQFMKKYVFYPCSDTSL
jgi:hypothetical protein